MGDIISIVGATAEVISLVLDGQEIYAKYKQRRLEILREALIKEMADGAINFQSEDDLVEVCVRVQTATILGAGRTNLRLMARLLKGLSNRQPIYASEFARHQRLMADLTDEEIILVCVVLEEWNAEKPGQRNSANMTYWQRIQGRLFRKPYETIEHIRGAVQAAQRTGLLIATTDQIVRPSPQLIELAEFVSLDESLWDDRPLSRRE